MEELELDWEAITADEDEFVFIQDALERIELFQTHEERIPSFEPSNYFAAAGVLSAIRKQGLVRGNRFCEWGSGFGIVTCLAAMAGFDACGIEIEANLIENAMELAVDYGLDVQYHHGSYRPEKRLDPETWASAFSGPQCFSPFEQDLIYIYPWPAEVAQTERLFRRFAPSGALMVSYQGGGNFRVRRH